uniref:Uncharacterized protein n=1 Tax=Calcidiscus leptoporus TaxID=127549 RepID=A0A7S0NNY0_9EUKA|mmetsp:Transcript_11564/g.26705  ORF Transcript_11564/g.26705 Transcript_11564/m.26705 type:complete len:504 (+) Transcript_11564:1-1512(+)
MLLAPPPPPPPLVAVAPAAAHAGESAASTGAESSTSVSVAQSGSKPGGSGIKIMMVLAIGALFCFRKSLLALLADYFPDSADGTSGEKTPKSRNYKQVDRARSSGDDETNSQTSCGLPEEPVDPIAEEWAARLAAQREGREYVSSACSPTCTALSAGLPTRAGCGGGAVPNFATQGWGTNCPAGNAYRTPTASAQPPPEEGFGGFDGFDDATDEFDEREGAWKRGAAPMPAPGMASSGMPAYAPGGASAGGMGMGAGVGGGVGGGGSAAGPPPGFGACGAGLQPAPNVDYGSLGNLGGGAPDIDWGLLDEPGACGRKPPAASSAAEAFVIGADEQEPAAADDEADDEEDEFTVFDGFGHDNKPSRGNKGNPSDSAAGLSWDEERKVWERQNKSVWGRGGRAAKSLGSPWDLRATSTFRSPASLQRIRAQAEKVFDDAIGNSLFTSPTMQRFKQQTEDLFSGVTSSFQSLASFFGGTGGGFGRGESGLFASTSSATTYFSSWFR